MQGLGSMVHGIGFEASEKRDYDIGLRVEGYGFNAQGLK